MRNNKRGICILVAMTSLLFSVCVSSRVVLAQEGKGGAVQTNGHIGFYQDTQPSSSSLESTSSSNRTVPSTKPTGGITKPAGLLPSTGEALTKGLTWSGLLLLLLSGVLFWRHKRKEDTNE